MGIIAKTKHLFLLGLSYKLKLIKPLNPPYHYNIESTNFCNFSCDFCPQSDAQHKYARKQGSLTTEKFRLFLERRRSINPGSSNIAICLDGEPLLNKRFPEFIEIANSQGVYPRFSTNARLLTPELSDKLLPKGDFLVSVDFSSSEEIFEKYRGGKGDFPIVLKNLQHFSNAIRGRKGHVLELNEIAGYSKPADPGLLDGMRDLFDGKSGSNTEIYERIFHNFAGHLGNKKKSETYKLCPYPWTQINATWEGDVVACCRDTQGKTILGNIFDQSMEEIWWGEKYQELRRGLVEKRPEDIAACKNCDMPWSAKSRKWKLSYVISSLLRR